MSHQIQKTLNPFTKVVTPVSAREVSNLQHYAKQAVRRALGMNRIEQVLLNFVMFNLTS